MGFEIKATGSDGRRYNSMADMLEAEGKRLIDDHVSAVERAIRSQRCPVHGEYAKAARQRTSRGVDFKISGCCDDLVERAQAAASRVNM